MKKIKTLWGRASLELALTVIFVALSSFSAVTLADDTDIYLNPVAPPPGSEPHIMFTLDMRPNLAAGMACTVTAVGAPNDPAAGDCIYSDSIKAALAYFGVSAGEVPTRFDVLRAALKVLLDAQSGVKVGFMIPHLSQNNCDGPQSTKKCSNGGYVLSGFKALQALDANGNKEALYRKLGALPNPVGSGHIYQGAEIFFELFRYLTGQRIHNSRNGWADFSIPGAGSTNLDELSEYGVTTDDYSSNFSDPAFDVHPMRQWDMTIEQGSAERRYISPFAGLSTESCPKISTVNFMFGVSSQDGDSNTAIAADKYTGGGLGVTPPSRDPFEWIVKFLHDTDLADDTWGEIPVMDGMQNLKSYFVIGANNVSKGDDYAKAGGTGDSAMGMTDNPDDLVNTLSDIFSRILSVSTTFVSSSVPVNVFNRTQYLDSVFMAVFQADEDLQPAWAGNVKKLKLRELDTGTVTIVDALGNPAIDGVSGRINFSALSFATDAAGYDVQSADGSAGEIVGRDGRSVNRGGGGQRIPGFLNATGDGPGLPGTANTDTGARQLFTEPDSFTNGTAEALRALNADSATAQSLWPYLNDLSAYASGTTRNAEPWSKDSDGVAHTWASAPLADQDEAVNLLKYARGLDLAFTDGRARDWIMGDTLHSKPLAINYGARAGYSPENPDIRILAGSNDGFLRMFQNTSTGGAETLTEDWAFMPHAAMAIQKQLRDNQYISGASLPRHPYGIDGEPAVYVKDIDRDGTIEAAEGDIAYLYFGMRRGGKAYYALDISNPDAPKILWKIEKGAAGSDFAELGLSFSNAVVGHMNYDGSGKKPVVIFAGGYDTNKDARSTSAGTNDSEGNAIFIVDASTGALVWKAVKGTSTSSMPNSTPTVFHHSELTDSLPARVAAIDTVADGLIDRLYVADTGGNVWRADVVNNVTDLDADPDVDDNRAHWSLTKLASLGRHAPASADKTYDRRFFHGIDVVKTSDSSGAYDAVIVASGDRANPLDYDIGSIIPENFLYMIKDRAVVSSATGSPDINGPTVEDAPYSHDGLADLSNNCFQETGVTCTTTQETNLLNGWKVRLEQGSGEKSLSRPVTFADTIYFTSYVPPNRTTNICSPSEGNGLLYSLSLDDASATADYNSTNNVGDLVVLQSSDRISSAGHGIPPELVIIGTNSKGELLIKTPTGVQAVSSASRYRTFWYEKEEE